MWTRSCWLAANNCEGLTVFEDGSDTVRKVELRIQWVGVVNAASCPTASKSTRRPVAQNGANAVIGDDTQAPLCKSSYYDPVWRAQGHANW